MSQAVANEDASSPRHSYPWLMLTEAFRLAISPQSILLALVGALVVCCGWTLSGALFLRGADRQFHDASAAEFHRYASRWPGARGPVEGLASFLPTKRDSKDLGDSSHNAAPIDPVVGVPYRLVEPFRRLMDAGNTWRSIGYYLLGGTCSLAVWALLGGAITRMAVVRFGLQQHVGLRESLSFACRKWTAYFTAPALPLIGIAMIAFPLVVFGWVMRLNVGVAMVGLLWVLVLLDGLLMALLALGLLFGWPLMWGTISTENSDAFDAISRSYAYTFQRPLHYLFYAFVAVVLGTLGWLLAWGFSEAIVALGYWGVSWGSGSERLQTVLDSGPEDQWSLRIGARIIELFVGLARAAASAFSYAYFWCVAAAAYLLLRNATDQTDLDDVIIEDDDEGVEFGLPNLDPDEAGVPGVGRDEKSAVRAANDT